MDASSLPLMELFTSLREAGLPLGLGEYQLLLQSLQGGFGTEDEAALKRLCQTLWVKSAAEQGIFDYQFERVMGEAIASAIAHAAKPELGPRTPASGKDEDAETRSGSRSRGSENTAEIMRPLGRVPWLLVGVLVLGALGAGAYVWRLQLQEPSGLEVTQPQPEPAATQPPSAAPATPEPTQSVLQTNLPDVVQLDQPDPPAPSSSLNVVWTSIFLGAFASAAGVTIWKLRQRLEQQRKQEEADRAQQAAQVPADLTQNIGDEIQAAQTVSQVLRSAKSGQPALKTQRVLTEDYLPVKQRQMKQCWRYLRLNRREGASTEMDVEATIRNIGKRGTFLDPVMVPRRVNRMELLLLVDRGGSMVPFHSMSWRLIETAVGAGRLGRSGVFYFRNFPGRSLYADPHQIQAIKSDRVLAQCLPRWTTVMIVSDGGALRGGYNSRRLLRTVAFLEQLQEVTRSLVWLNPMPRERWAGTTAEGIAQQVPMVEMSREGLQGAIGYAKLRRNAILRGREAVHGH